MKLWLFAFPLLSSSSSSCPGPGLRAASCVFVSLMAPRRPRSTSNVSASNTISRAPTSSPQLRKQFALAFDSIYQHNLNVIKRRDPSIVSILDQFSHVCLYNFDGKANKWLREGHEGSIFIVEQYVDPRIFHCALPS